VHWFGAIFRETCFVCFVIDSDSVCSRRKGILRKIENGFELDYESPPGGAVPNNQRL